ncbi:hypothetical protein cyc_06110 [Cyclospora cayetanensis]|uniref:Uncharacterized protein n=1 Tax=Cyclospora cayetanensis TaxID=88456 RepID=A0A1D3D416_9EIME|nr:hypothetical protein cyc_06110 [Cyclospora cayetanensis]
MDFPEDSAATTTSSPEQAHLSTKIREIFRVFEALLSRRNRKRLNSLPRSKLLASSSASSRKVKAAFPLAFATHEGSCSTTEVERVQKYSVPEAVHVSNSSAYANAAKDDSNSNESSPCSIGPAFSGSVLAEESLKRVFLTSPDAPVQLQRPPSCPPASATFADTIGLAKEIGKRTESDKKEEGGKAAGTGRRCKLHPMRPGDAKSGGRALSSNKAASRRSNLSVSYSTESPGCHYPVLPAKYKEAGESPGLAPSSYCHRMSQKYRGSNGCLNTEYNAKSKVTSPNAAASPTPAPLCRSSRKCSTGPSSKHLLKHAIPKLNLEAINNHVLSSCVSSTRRLLTLKEYVEQQRRLKEVASEAAEGKLKFQSHRLLVNATLPRITMASKNKGDDARHGIFRSSSRLSLSEVSSSPAARLEKVLAEADDAFWTSRNLDHMAGWVANKPTRPSHSGRPRRSTTSMRSNIEGVMPTSAPAAISGALTTEVIQQQLHHLAEKMVGSRCTSAAVSPIQQPDLSNSAGGLVCVSSGNRFLQEGLRAREEAREYAKRRLNALLNTRYLHGFFDPRTRLYLIQHIRSNKLYPQQLTVDALKRIKSCRQSDMADFVEAWYSDLLETAAAGIRGEAEWPNGSATTPHPVYRLLELMRGDLQRGLRYDNLIEFVCDLKESDVETLMATVLLKSSMVFGNPLLELHRLLVRLTTKFGRTPLPLQTQLLRALLTRPHGELKTTRTYKNGFSRERSKPDESLKHSRGPRARCSCDPELHPS